MVTPSVYVQPVIIPCYDFCCNTSVRATFYQVPLCLYKPQNSFPRSLLNYKYMVQLGKAMSPSKTTDVSKVLRPNSRILKKIISHVYAIS